MKIANIEVGKHEIITCLDLAYHELKHVYYGNPFHASEVIRSNMRPDLRREYYKNPEFRNKLLEVLKYSVKNSKKIVKYFDRKIKKLPKINDREVDTTDLELIVELSKVVDLDPAPIVE